MIYMEEDKQIPLLLGRPFLATGAALIDVKKGELTLIVGEEKGHFNMNQSLKQSDFDNAECKNIEQVIPISPELTYECKIQNSMNENMKNFQYIEAIDLEYLNSGVEFKETVLNLKEISAEKSSNNEEKDQEVEKSYEGLILKELAKHLKYPFLGAERAQPVIIAAGLIVEKEQKLIGVLRKYKEAIAWLVKDLKGTSPSIFMYKILLEENAKTSIEHQKRLNPVMKEIVRKVVLKWLNAGFIYAISDNPWVSPVHVVPKKGGFTVIRNEKDVLIPTRTVTGWRVCIDYRKLNTTTRNDFYPFPFIDQMLDRLAGHPYFCFLDGYLMSLKVIYFKSIFPIDFYIKVLIYMQEPGINFTKFLCSRKFRRKQKLQ